MKTEITVVGVQEAADFAAALHTKGVRFTATNEGGGITIKDEAADNVPRFTFTLTSSF